MITLAGTQKWYHSSYEGGARGKDCTKVSQTPSHGETFTIGEGITVKALHTPCHTQDSICYLFEDGNDRAVFTGDTLFIGGECVSTQRESD
ncbi:Cytoplasmic glyoxalase II [Teratosphaeriaceae sp. CCFEE 6253]|nr:Cytoplasmic glyoxalase II [Teratosphaeriaceae sp. CCFEE 6253]